MIEALIRDDKRLICLVCIQAGPDKESLNVDIFIPSKGQTLSGLMPAGGEPAQQVARAVMTVYPISALSPAWTEARKDRFLTPPLDRSSETLDEPKTTLPEKEPDRYAGPSTKEALAELDRRTYVLDQYEKSLGEREKQLNRDIKNFRKSHPAS